MNESFILNLMKFGISLFVALISVFSIARLKILSDQGSLSLDGWKCFWLIVVLAALITIFIISSVYCIYLLKQPTCLLEKKMDNTSQNLHSSMLRIEQPYYAFSVSNKGQFQSVGSEG